MFLIKFAGLFNAIVAFALASDFCPSPTAAQEQPCPPEWTFWRGSCYRLTQEAATWNDSKRACQDIGGWMAVPHSPYENEFLRKMMPDKKLWLGCTDQEIEGTWMCEGQGQVDQFSNWKTNEPNNAGNEEDCTEILTSGKWNDRKCCKNRKALCACPSKRKLSRYCFLTDAHGRISNSKCLVGHLIREFVCGTITNCGLACLREPRCYSFNVKMQGGQKVCQLNNATRSDDPTKFQDTGSLCMYSEPCF